MVNRMGKDKGLQIEQCRNRAEKWWPVMIQLPYTVMGKQYWKAVVGRSCGKAHSAGMIEKSSPTSHACSDAANPPEPKDPDPSRLRWLARPYPPFRRLLVSAFSNPQLPPSCGDDPGQRDVAVHEGL
jgi:hypothetical protein